MRLLVNTSFFCGFLAEQRDSVTCTDFVTGVTQKHAGILDTGDLKRPSPGRPTDATDDVTQHLFRVTLKCCGTGIALPRGADDDPARDVVDRSLADPAQRAQYHAFA